MPGRADDESFLARWSRRKAGRAEPPVAERPAIPVARREPLPPRIATEGAADPAPAAASVPAARSNPAACEGDAVPEPAAPLPTLADVAELTHASDYSRFVAPGVDSTVRNAAMRKLFTDPHFNVMDGLDTYIDDYGKPDPIEPALLRRLNVARELGLFEDDAPAPGIPHDVLASPPADARGDDGTGQVPARDEDSRVAAADATPAPTTDMPPPARSCVAGELVERAGEPLASTEASLAASASPATTPTP